MLEIQESEHRNMFRLFFYSWSGVKIIDFKCVNDFWLEVKRILKITRQYK